MKAIRQAAPLAVVIAATISILPAKAYAGEGFLWLPFTGAYTPYVTCRWTCLRDDGTTYYHHATDFGRTRNTTDIVAAAAGTVIWVHDGLSPGQLVDDYPYGNHVRIRHANGYVTWYAHLLRTTIRVHEEQMVSAGDLLGTSDNSGASTGPHLHFEVQDPQGRRVNPYGTPPDYTGGCGPNALWVTCPPTPAPPPDSDGDGFTVAQGDCDDRNRDVHPGAAESCNGLDDDCNGTTDDSWRVGLSTDLDRPCTVGIGACASDGTWICALNGATVVCGAESLPPQSESCNGLDDDCDGETDEDWRAGLAQDIGNPCTVSWDACRGSTTGTWVCAPGGLSTVCDAPTPPGTPAVAEICNGVDDDCNDTIDDLESVVLSEGQAYRQHPAIVWDATNDQFGIVWVERSIGAYQLFFQLLSGDGNPIGSPREIGGDGDRYATYGTDIAWDGAGYGIVWLTTPTGATDASYEIIFIRVDASGAIVQPARSVSAGPWVYSGSTSYFLSRVRIVARADQYTVGVMTWLPGSLTLHRLSMAGDLIGEPSESLSTMELSEIFALAAAGGDDIVAWDQYPGISGSDYLTGIWDGASIRRTTIEPNYYGWRFGTSATCSEVTCQIRSLVSLFGSVEMSVYEVDTTTMVATESVRIPYGRAAVEAAMSCRDGSCTIASSSILVGVPDRAINVVLFQEDERMFTLRTPPDISSRNTDGQCAFAVSRGAAISVVVWSESESSIWIVEPSRQLIATKLCP